jgi:isopentenyldiphosphate isomerase
MGLAQDPDELFDIYDAHANPTGAVKRRADVHKDGDWHRAIHVWVLGEDTDGPWIMFQRRGLGKDTWPGELDCTVGGHIGTGETIEDAYREIHEEIGITIAPDQLRYVGRRMAVSEEPGLHIDHEIQEVFFVRDDRPLLEYRPNQDELDSLVRLPLEPLLDLLSGDRASIVGFRRPATSDDITTLTLTRDGLKHPADNYFYRVAIAARNYLRGDRHVAV